MFATESTLSLVACYNSYLAMNPQRVLLLFLMMASIPVFWCRPVSTTTPAAYGMDGYYEGEVCSQEELLSYKLISSCTYPPKRSNRARTSCKLDPFSFEDAEKYCLESKETKRFYCKEMVEKEIQCWCHFNELESGSCSVYTNR